MRKQMRNVFNFFLFYSLIAVKSTYAQVSNTPEDISHPPIYTTIDDLTSETIKEPGLINFVREWTALAPINNQFEFTNSSATSVNQKTSYFDGLGRQIQIVVKEGSQNFKDLVLPQIYDNYGREIYKVLSYQASGSSGNFYSSPLSEQSSFLQSKYPYEQVFYSKTEYEPSPLNRINKTYAPGNSWAGSGRGISYKYLISTEADAVRVWNVENNIPVSPSAYLPGELYKNVTIDEAGNAVVEYKDKDGLVILKKVQAEDNTPADYSGYDKWLCTYYIYDDLGRLCFVLSPKAVKMLYEAPRIWEVNSNNLEILNELCFQYKYDSRSRLKAKKVPGADWVYMAYDSRDRLVFTQDGNMRLRNQWLSNLYDNLNRVVITGMTNYSGSFEDLQTYINTPRGSTSYNSEGTSISATVSISTLQSGLIHIQAAEIITFDPGFTTDNSTSLIAEIITGTSESIDISEDPFPPNSTFIPLTITYYDNYPSQNLFNPANNTKLDAGNNLHPVTLPQQSEQKVIGMVTGNKIRILSDPENLSQGGWLESYIYYDKYGRVLQTNSKNNIGGRDEITNMYDFSGKLLCSYLLHTTANPNEETGIATSMEYDHTGALIKVSKRINGGENKLILENEYNELGQLAKKKLGKNPSDDDPLETLNYDYNIRGWLKGINSGYVKGSDNNNWFGMDLSYDWGFTLNQYNGNISGTKWRSKGDGEQRSYGFGYDNVNRLMFADFNQYSDGGWNKSAGVDFTTIMGNGINHSTAYDENGNIKGMKQWGLKLTSSSLIDDLSYNYMPNSNKLLNVIDNSNDAHTKLGDFRSSVLYQQSEPVKTTTTIDYEYDINGNLTKDLNKDIFPQQGMAFSIIILTFLIK
ncbi:MAG: hypothetical protein JST62_10970 [Bacteroidetes bacterium]|nr:hypothetical protein [Bacteroidota bacterium]